MRKPGAQALTIVTLGVGLLLFIFAVRQAGFAEIGARVRAIGAGFILILALAGVKVLARSFAWWQSLAPGEREVGFWAIVRARLVGDSAGQIFVAGPIVAEPARLAALEGGVGLGARVKSLAVETLTYALSSCLMVLSGVMALLAYFALSERMRVASWLAVTLMIAVLVTSIAVIVGRWTILSGVGEIARRLLHLVGFSRRWKRQVAHLRTLEHHVFAFYRERRWDFFIILLCNLIFHLAGIIETWLTLVLLGYWPTRLAAFTLEASNRAINMIFSFVPARVGVDEAGTALLTEVLGLGAAAGIILAIVRKARVLFWTAVGVGIFGWQVRKAKKKKV